MSATVTDAFFLESGSGARCFCVLHRPVDKPRGVIVHVPAFAEEMNKSRRMVALAARAFAEEGWATVVVDLAGCGDSSGELQDFAWDDWLEDIDAAVRWAEGQADGAPTLWGLRAGCLLICDWLRTRSRSLQVLFWQPVVNGKQHLTQFLRIRAAAEMLTESDARGAVAALRSSLDAGECVEVAGYSVCPPLAGGISSAVLGFDDVQRNEVITLEVAGGSDGALSPGLAMSVSRWQAAGLDCRAVVVGGTSFWSTVDVTTAPELINATCSMLAGVVCRT